MKAARLNWIPFAIFLLSLGPLAVGCGSQEAPKSTPKATAPLVTTAPVQMRRVVYTLEQVGSLRSSERAMLRAEVAGVVSRISFQEGARVKKGQVLVRLDDAKIKAEIRNLEAHIEQLQVRLAFQEKTLERNRILLKKNAIAPHRFDELQTAVKETELAISQVKANLVRQRESLIDTVIRAPFDGVVGSKDISPGDYLKVGGPVVEVVVLDPLEIDFQVPERYKSSLTLGQEVSLRVASENEKRFVGTIFFISPTVDMKTRTFLVKAKVANPDRRLNPGMFARVSLVTAVHDQAAVVPWQSVIQTETDTYIYVLKDGLAHRVDIRLGKVTPQWAEVLSPQLKADTPVVAEGKFMVKEGGKVEIKKAPPAPVGGSK